MQYKGCNLIRQEGVWYSLQSNISHIFEPVLSHLRSTRSTFVNCAIIILAAFFPNFANAEPPTLELPIDCQLGQTCWLVNHVDTDPGPGDQDYRCGAMTYNTHRGTDIAIANKRVMAAGIAILAAESGTVIGIRDGMPETSPDELKSRTNIRGRECGNGVTIRHEGKWTTQYCHMKSGSVRVQRGDVVKTGDKLGQLGLSGLTEFPHIHLAVRKGDTIIDPFTGGAQSSQCVADNKVGGLWAESARKALEYPGAQPFHAGFDAGRPDIAKLRAGQLTERVFAPSSPALVFWSEVYTLKKGDVIRMRLLGPDGAVINQSKTIVERPMARRFGFVGKKRPKDGWPVGTYTGRVDIMQKDRSNIAQKDRLIKQEATAIVE